MTVEELVYTILDVGMGRLNRIFNDLEEWHAFLVHFLGTEVLHHVWYLPRSEGVISRRARRGHVAADPSDSAPTASGKTRLLGPVEYACHEAYACFFDILLKPWLRKALRRRAERRVAKAVVGLAVKRITDKSGTSWESGLVSAEQGHLAAVLAAGLGAAAKVLDASDRREIERGARNAALDVLWQSLSQSQCDQCTIEDALSAALEAGMDTVPDSEADDGEHVRAAVETTLARWLAVIEDGLKKSVIPLTDIRELQRHAKCNPATEGEDQGTRELVSAAFLQGVRKAMSTHGLPAHGPIRDAVEACSKDLRHRLTESLADPNRVGKHAANFLKSEVSRVKKRALQRARRVPIEDPGKRNDRQVLKHLGELREQGTLVSRKQRGCRDLFWGFREWEKDETRWARSTAFVNVEELADKLPEFKGKPKTTASIDTDLLDTFLPKILRHHGCWLMTRHFYAIIRLKTTYPITREESETETANEGDRDPIKRVADPCAEQSIRQFELFEMLDKEPMSNNLRV